MKSLKLTASLVILTIFALSGQAPAAVLVSTNSTWQYFKALSEPSTPVEAWREVGFNDSSWLTGDSPFFYERGSGYSGNTDLTSADMEGSYSGIYMRHVFPVGNPADIAQLRISLQSDDGCIVWINGTEVQRVNTAAGFIPFTGSASGAAGEPNEVIDMPLAVDPATLLNTGDNVLAIHALNASLSGSSDFLIEASLSTVDIDLIPPTITTVDPARNTTFPFLNQITVTFSEPVQNVDPFDLLIDGVPANSMIGEDDTYTFFFPQPDFGNVQISWSTTHGITDFAVPPNSFDENAAGASWQYILEDNLAPTVVSTVPAKDTIVRGLDSIAVTFSEDVTGVNASDLRINGNAAANLQTISANEYIFSFPQPATGAVTVAFAPGHGITDLAISPNAFAGDSWGYTLDPNAEEGTVLITEFMAVNDEFLGTIDPDADPQNPSIDDTIYPDWIEIHNSGALTAQLGGWFLTDDPDDLQKWRFPSTNLLSKQYMIIFASGENRRVPGAPLHANFSLGSGGEFLALVKPDGVTIASSFTPEYPPQLANVSYGLPTVSAPNQVVSDTAPVRINIPMDGSLTTEWTKMGFNDSSWTAGSNGVGYEGTTSTSPNLSPAINTDVTSIMRNVSASAYIRIPFTIPDISVVSQLTLKMKYDDGFAAYINGGEVARANVPNNQVGGTNVFVQWDETALTSRLDGSALMEEEFDVSFSTAGMVSGENILSIHGLNTSAGADDFLIAATLEARTADIQVNAPRYFVTPTPGGPNGVGVDNLGPVLSDLEQDPKVPLQNESMKVTVQVSPTFSENITSVVLNYRVMFNAENSVAMNDTGSGADKTAGDGIYSATIPAGIASPGQMIRWYVTAADGLGNTSRLPAFDDPLNSREYEGTIVYLQQTNNLPIFHWFIQNPSGANNNIGTRCSIFFKGRFYDNLLINIHGQSSRGFPKRSYDIDFHGNEFIWDEDEISVDDINFLQTYSDKANVRNVLPYRLIADAGATHHWVIPVRVHQNGTFYAEYDMMENGDDRYLKRQGKDPNGALYKMYTTFSTATHANVGINTNAEKKTRKEEPGSDDLHELYDNFVSTANGTVERRRYMWDNINLPATINFLASMAAASSHDCCHKNYYVYRDSEGTGEWEGMIWDVDLSFGRRWNGSETYWDNNMHQDTGFVGGNNGFFSQLMNGGSTVGGNETRSMYTRRIRTIMDELFQSNDVPLADRRLERQLDEWLEAIGPDAQLDLERWGTWTDGSGTPIFDVNHVDYETMPEAIARLKQHLIERREYVFGGQGPFSNLPPRQPDDATVAFGVIDFNPASGNQDQEYIELINTNSYAIDISEWELDGAVSMKFQGGVVIPAGMSLYVSPNVRAFRARTVSPRGGENRFVQGAYSGQLSARGEEIILLDRKGKTNRTFTYVGSPSLAQQYLRVTEIMYHPAPAPAGSDWRAEDYEYLEVKNIGGVTVSLIGVKFSNGVSFNFSDSAVTSLAPGESVLVVKNEAAFVSRYGSGYNIAGEYAGFLDNGGERIQFLDDDNEEILDFSYRDWYPTTDGLGFSLVVVDENNPIFSTWDERENWRPSGEYAGSPGADDPPVVVVAPILVNEALTHTDLPQVDTVELYNPTANTVDIGGWFLSDDFIDARKYRIPDGRTIPPHDYVTFTENDFNMPPEDPNSFSLSSKGDEIYVFSGNGTDLTGYFHGHNFGAAQNGVTFGRHIISTGKEHFVPQASSTLTFTNSLPRVGPIVISEIHYHPVDLAGGEDNDGDEFVELHNITGLPVKLFNPDHLTNTWELRDAVRYAFPQNVTMAAGSYLLVVGFDPTEPGLESAFRTKFNVPAGVPIYGPWSGKLDNSSEDVELFWPDNPDIETAEIPYIRTDKVDYKDNIPWTSAADGIGPSLQRLADTEYGNDPINWFGAAPTPGRGINLGIAPTITSQPPTNLVAVLGNSFEMTVTATGDPILNYQWRRDGSTLPGENGSTISFSKLSFGDSGVYDVVVFNNSGSEVSLPIELRIQVPASINSQPVSRIVKQGENVTFSVSVSSESEIFYQWRHNGVNITGATDSSLTLNDLEAEDRGVYDVLITDDVGTIASAEATLEVLIPPIVIHPTGSMDLRVVQGQDLLVSVEVSPESSVPLTYTWRRGFFFQTSAPLNRYKTFFLLQNVQPHRFLPFDALVTVSILNPFSTAAITVTNYLTVLTDADGDFMSDEFEIANQLNENDPSDKDMDPDDDGMTNYEESIAGTDPMDSDSYLRIEEISAGEGVRITFNAVATRTYTVEYKEDPREAMWHRLTDVPSDAVDREVTVEDKDGSSARIYRLATPQIDDGNRLVL